MSFFEEYFGDPRYRNERILLAVGAPVTLLLIAGLVFLLMVVGRQDDRREAQEPDILTADRIQEPVVAPVEVTPMQKGLDALSENNYDKAREYFLSVQGRDRFDALRCLAIISREQGNHQEAIEFLNESIGLEPSALAYFLRGDSWRALGDITQARKDIEESAAMDPSEPVISNALLLLRIEMGEKEEVEQTLHLRASLGLASTVPSWVLAAVAVSLSNNDNELAAVLLQESFASLPEADFDLLLTYRAIEEYQNNPVLLPYYIKASVERQR